MNETARIKLIAVDSLNKSANTELARALGHRLNALIISDADEVNPVLGIPSAGPEDYQLKKHLLRLVDRYKAQRRLRQTDIFQDIIISDYLFYADRIYAAVNLQPEDFPLYEHIIEFMEKEITIPDLVIYLQHSPEGALRVLTGDRKHLSGLSVNQHYIDALCNEYNEFFMWYRWSPVLIVNADRFSCNNTQHLEDLIAKIQKPFSGIVYYNPPDSW